MATTPSIVHDLSDTARWAAVFRAGECERPDALFRDHFAARLAGPRGFAIARELSNESHSTSWVVRTHLFDQFIAREIRSGVDTVVNLGAGLDARPYRMKLPPWLRWIEVDAPEIIAYKKKVLAMERPTCLLERMSLDLRDYDARRALLTDLNGRGRKILVLTEGVLIYLDPEDAGTLAKDLARHAHFQRWILEIVSPAVLDTMQRTAGQQLQQAGASFRFGPAEGTDFFAPRGWELVDVQGVLKTAVRLARTPIDPKFLDFIPDLPTGAPDSLPWVGVCLFQSQETGWVSPI
jgi:methyltransferase (TIGR00027 family)